jgi:hypothetical protein
MLKYPTHQLHYPVFTVAASKSQFWAFLELRHSCRNIEDSSSSAGPGIHVLPRSQPNGVGSDGAEDHADGSCMIGFLWFESSWTVSAGQMPRVCNVLHTSECFSIDSPLRIFGQSIYPQFSYLNLSTYLPLLCSRPWMHLRGRKLLLLSFIRLFLDFGLQLNLNYIDCWDRVWFASEFD